MAAVRHKIVDIWRCMAQIASSLPRVSPKVAKRIARPRPARGNDGGKKV